MQILDWVASWAVSQWCKHGYVRICIDGRQNSCFVAVARFLLGDLSGCVDLLVDSGRIPEAAFFARTYLPSRISEVRRVALDGCRSRTRTVPNHPKRVFPVSLMSRNMHATVFPVSLISHNMHATGWQHFCLDSEHTLCCCHPSGH